MFKFDFRHYRQRAKVDLKDWTSKQNRANWSNMNYI